MPVSPPRPKGPPLNALRAFEAAARNGGFAGAAEELCVTPGAVSQHIRALEDWAGYPLFERHSQGVQLTDEGRQVASLLATAFDTLGDAVGLLRALAPEDHVQIAALPSIAQLWLSHRLPDIRQALAPVNLSVSALETPPNLRRAPFDLSIFMRRPTGAPGEILLADDMILPVCAPSLAAQLHRPEDLQACTFLHDASWIEDWPLWAGSEAPDLQPDMTGPQFSLYSMALEEAKNGAGVLIGHLPLIERDLAAGTLVAPFDKPVSTGRSLVLEHGAADLQSRVLRQVIAMLRQSAG